MATVATGQVPPAGLTPARTTTSIAAPALRVGRVQQPAARGGGGHGPVLPQPHRQESGGRYSLHGTPPFQGSIPAIAVPVNISADANDPEVLAIGGFLRVLNALENIRSSLNVVERGRAMGSDGDARELA